MRLLANGHVAVTRNPPHRVESACVRHRSERLWFAGELFMRVPGPRSLGSLRQYPKGRGDRAHSRCGLDAAIARGVRLAVAPASPAASIAAAAAMPSTQTTSCRPFDLMCSLPPGL